MIAMAASWLMFQPWVQREALLTEALPSLPWLSAPQDPPWCRPGLPSAGYRLDFGACPSGPGLHRVGLDPPPEPPCPCACWQPGGLGEFAPLVAVFFLHLLLAAAAAAGKSPSMRVSGGEPPVAMATAGQPWQLGFTRQGGITGCEEIIRELIHPRMGRRESWDACKAAGGTAVQRRALCLLAVAGRVKAAEFGLSCGGIRCCLGPPPGLCASPTAGSGVPRAVQALLVGQGEQIPQSHTQQS